jgi:hypothetical protein
VVLVVLLPVPPVLMAGLLFLDLLRLLGVVALEVILQPLVVPVVLVAAGVLAQFPLPVLRHLHLVRVMLEGPGKIRAKLLESVVVVVALARLAVVGFLALLPEEEELDHLLTQHGEQQLLQVKT